MSTCLLIWLLAQVHVWVGSLCPLLLESTHERFVAYPAVLEAEVLREFRLAPNGMAIAVLGLDHHPTASRETLRVVSIAPQGETRELASFELAQSIDESLTISETGDWLYAVADRGASSLMLASGGEQGEVLQRPLAQRRLARWLPLRESPAASGALVQFSGPNQVEVHEIGFEGAREVGSFTLSHQRLIAPRWAASLLPDGMVAVSWIEEEWPGSFAIEIRVTAPVAETRERTVDAVEASGTLDPDVLPDEISIRCGEGRRFHHSLTSAVGDAGRLAIVVRSLTADGAIIQSLVIDPDRPRDAVECVHLDDGGGQALEPRVLSFGEEFVVFWRTGGPDWRLMARRIRADGRPVGGAVSLGPLVPGIAMRSHYFVQKVDAQTFLAVIPGSEGLVVRRFPAETGVAGLLRFCERGSP